MYVVSIGEFLWDVIGDAEYIGGAPFNLCVHLSRLGHRTSLVSAVGFDRLGSLALEQAADLGVDTRYLKRTKRAGTGISKVSIDEHGVATHSLPRPAAYDFPSLTPAEHIEVNAAMPDWISYGTLAQAEPCPRLLTQQLIAENPESKRFYDVNLRPRSWNPGLVEHLLRLASAVKLNDDEARTLAGVFDWPIQSLRRFCALAMQHFNLDLICITRGADGCVMARPDEYVEAAGYKVRVSDTVGAGDAFSAAILHGLYQEWPLRKVCDFANRVGALVSSRPGATPAWTIEEASNLGQEVAQ